MNIYVSNDIWLTGNIPDYLYKWIIEQLTFDNPAYQKAERYGFNTHKVPKKISLYQWRGEQLIIPRGIARRLLFYLKQNSVPYTLKDDRVFLPEVSFHSNIKLRDYQQDAVTKVLKGTQGFLVSPCGSGKTVMMIEMMTRIKQPTLFIVHQKELMDQIITTATNLTDLTKGEIGVIGAGKRIVGERMTVATIQTLNRGGVEDLIDKFGAVFIDEAHHVAAKTFFNVISQFKGRYRLAVSATPERADGLNRMVYACTGAIVHEITQDLVPTILPSLRVVRTAFSSSASDYMSIVKRLIVDKNRNQLIVETIKREVEGNYCLVLSDRVEHLRKLQRLLAIELPHIQCEIVTGATNKTERKGIMERAKNKEIDVLLATQLAREGLDIPHLNRLFLTYPKKAAASVQQEVGRVMRPAEGKNDAIVYDFVDQNGVLINQFKQRKEVYEKIGMG